MVNLLTAGYYNIDDLLRIMEALRAPGGCPWDRAQTHQSIRANMLEEAYEAAGAIDCGDWNNLKEELGDVLLFFQERGENLSCPHSHFHIS